MIQESPKPAQICDVMTWYVQFRRGTTDKLVEHPSPEAAIETACRLLDDGCDVYSIGTGPLTN
jgi:predicted dinucleotide-utilizing enzyme